MGLLSVPTSLLMEIPFLKTPDTQYICRKSVRGAFFSIDCRATSPMGADRAFLGPNVEKMGIGPV